MGTSTIDIYIRERKGGRRSDPLAPRGNPVQKRRDRRGVLRHYAKWRSCNPYRQGTCKGFLKSEFPGAARNDPTLQRGSWDDPANYHKTLEDWRKNQTPLTILVTGYPINLDVFLEDYTATATGGFGDIEYEVEFTEDRDLSITETESSEDGSSGGTTDETKRPAEETTSYTIKTGDCMWNIAEQYLGDGSRWPEIYEANKEIIDSEAKKYGNSNSMNGTLIYAGVTLKIPQT